jgi:hypothetical protein
MVPFKTTPDKCANDGQQQADHRPLQIEGYAVECELGAHGLSPRRWKRLSPCRARSLAKHGSTTPYAADISFTPADGQAARLSTL